MTAGLLNYMEEMGFETINDFCGKALPNIFRHNDLSRAYKLYSQPDAEKCVGCGRCVAVCADSAYSYLIVRALRGHDLVDAIREACARVRGAYCLLVYLSFLYTFI